MSKFSDAQDRESSIYQLIGAISLWTLRTYNIIMRKTYEQFLTLGSS